MLLSSRAENQGSIPRGLNLFLIRLHLINFCPTICVRLALTEKVERL